MFRFIQLAENHLSRFRSWLKKDHVKRHWTESEDEKESRDKFLNGLPKRGIQSFMIEMDGAIIGYIQYYEASKVGGGWWENETPGTFGIDVLIGDENYIGKGHGTNAIKAFISFLLSREKGVNSILVDPHPKNQRAIRAFEKNGFVKGQEIKSPNGEALLMKLMLAGAGDR